MKKTWIIILSTILAIVVVLQIAVMVFLKIGRASCRESV